MDLDPVDRHAAPDPGETPVARALLFRTAETFYGPPPDPGRPERIPIPPDAGPAEWVIFRYWPKGVPFVRPQGFALGREIQVRLNHARWIADCPYCGSAQVASDTDPRFFCPHCLHASDPAAEARWIRLVWPAPETRARIEDVVIERLRHDRMNWLPHETVEQLEQENRDHGIPVPPEREPRAGGGGGR